MHASAVVGLASTHFQIVCGCVCRGLNEHTNFERFWTAALTLFKVATNDNWTDVMVACLVGVSRLEGSDGCASTTASLRVYLIRITPTPIECEPLQE